MRRLHGALIGLLLSGSALAVPIEMSGSFEEIVPDAIQGQDSGVFFGVGSIQETTAGYFYLQAVGLDGKRHWQLIPLDWQWTMHESPFWLVLDDTQFTLSGPELAVGPMEGMSLTVAGDALTVNYLGWAIAHGKSSVLAVSVPEPSSLALMAIGALMLVGARQITAARGQSDGLG